MKKFEIRELPKCDKRHDVGKCCLQIGAYTLDQNKATTNLQLKKKKCIICEGQ